MTYQSRILCFEITQLNHPALPLHQGPSAVPCEVLPSGAGVAALPGCESYTRAEFMGIQNCRNGKHLDAKINNFRVLLSTTQDTTHRIAWYNGRWELPTHKYRIGCTFQINNCMQRSPVLTMILRFKLRVWKVNPYLRLLDAQEARAGEEGTKGMTECCWSNAQGCVMVRWIVFSNGNCNNNLESSSWRRSEDSLTIG